MRVRCPHVLILDPLAAVRVPEGARACLSAADAGKTLTSAPVSTKKEVPVCLSHTDRVLDPKSPAAVAIDDRPLRFPVLQDCCRGKVMGPVVVQICIRDDNYEPLFQIVDGKSK